MSEIYAAIVLDEPSQARLRRFADPVHKPYAHHVTLAFGTEITDAHRALVGRKVVMRVIGIARCDKLVVGEVVLSDDLHCCNRFPHVTISVAMWHAPVEANGVLAEFHEGNKFINIDYEWTQVRLQGTCDIFVKDDEDSHAKWLNGSK